MSKTFIVNLRRIFLLCSFFLLANGISGISTVHSDTIQISGAGIKGPLAFADVKIFSFDPAFPDYYDKTSPISTTITNEYAEIHGLSFLRRSTPPYILTVNGSSAIDLNTGVAPVINTLITVVTDDMLGTDHPIFATPLTTLAFHMALLKTEARSYRSYHAKSKAFSKNLSDAASIVSSTFAVGQDKNIDLFRAPLVINDYTIDLAEQELAVYHRAAVEALAAKLYSLSLLGDTTPDAIIQRLALDLYRDDIIDNADNGKLVGDIDPRILDQDPMSLLIPNTVYRVKDIMKLMAEERILIGTHMGPTFLIDEIAYPEETTVIDSITVTDSVVSAGSIVNLTGTGSNNTQLNEIDPLSPEIQLYVDHDSHPIGPYTEQDVFNDFDAISCCGGVVSESISIVPDPTGDPARGNVMRVFQAKGSHTYEGGSDGQWQGRVNGEHEELYFAFDYYREPDAIMSKGQKMSGLLGGDWAIASGGHPSYGQAFSARMMFYADATYPGKVPQALATYAYYGDTTQSPKWWDDSPEVGEQAIKNGVWQTIETRVKMNTVGKSDGILQGWVDGVLVLDNRNFVWRDSRAPDLKISGLYVTFGYGGGDDTWDAPEDQFNYYDNWIVSTRPIAH